MSPAIQKLERAINWSDSFNGSKLDTSPVMVDHHNTLYELVDDGGTNMQLTLGDLRAIIAAALA